MFFSLWDTDHSESMSMDELARMLECIKEGTGKDTDIAYMISKMDSDRDGTPLLCSCVLAH